jgi:hypothetical protein
MSNTNDSLHSSKPDYSIEQDFESKSHLSDSFLDGQDFTHLFSYRTPSVDSLHTPKNHSTLRKLTVDFNNIPQNIATMARLFSPVMKTIKLNSLNSKTSKSGIHVHTIFIKTIKYDTMLGFCSSMHNPGKLSHKFSR